jgi:hypothetical protein
MKSGLFKRSSTLIFGVVVVAFATAWLLLSRNSQDIEVPSDFRVERQVAAEGSGEIMPHLDISIEDGTLWYGNRKQSRKLTDSELKILISKQPWPVNDTYTSDGGGDTVLTALVIAGNGEEKRIRFDDAWGTKVAQEVLEFDAYLNKLAGYPSYRFEQPR